VKYTIADVGQNFIVKWSTLNMKKPAQKHQTEKLYQQNSPNRSAVTIAKMVATV
jgi:hypothetical protein